MIVKVLKRLLFVCLLLALMLLALWWFWFFDTPPKSQAFVNATVLTMDASNSEAQAVLVRGSKIVFVGRNETVLSQTDDNTVIHDLQGRVLMPGIIDAHGHFPGDGIFAVAANLNPPPVNSVTNISDLQARLREQIAAKPSFGLASDWVFGFGYDETVLVRAGLTDVRHPNRHDLDAVSTEHPIFISHVSGHYGVVNSRGLEVLGINNETPNPQGGEFLKDDDGVLTGVLKETAALIALREATDFSLFDTLKIINSANRFYVEHGVTTAQNGAADRNTIASIRMASKFSLIPIRIQVWPTADTTNARQMKELQQHQTDSYQVGAVKLLIDGSIQTYSAYLSKPYHVPPVGENNDYRGHALIPKDKLIQLVKAYHEQGIQMALHGNGDAAIDDILDAIKMAQQSSPNRDARHIVIHAQMARDDQLQRMFALGVTPSFFSAHTYYWGDQHNQTFMGPERARRMSPAKSAIDLGLRFSIHLDAPVVPMQPMRLIWSAVNRRSYADNIIGEEQRITPLQALRATTIDAAWQIFMDDQIGSIEAGKFADMIVLDDNPLLRPLTIDQVKVLQTFVGGREVFNVKD